MASSPLAPLYPAIAALSQASRIAAGSSCSPPRLLKKWCFLMKPPPSSACVIAAPQSAPGNQGAMPVVPPPQAQQQTAGGVTRRKRRPVQGVDDGTPAAGNVADEAGRAGGRGTAAARAPVQEAIDRPGGAAVPPPNNNDTAIQQLLASYASAMESLNPSAVAAVYPNVDTRALGAACCEYASLNEEIDQPDRCRSRWSDGDRQCGPRDHASGQDRAGSACDQERRIRPAPSGRPAAD